MKRRAILAVLVFVVAVGGWGQSVGGGVSVFLPESLYWNGDGSVSVETALSTSFGLGEFLSFPIGISYNQVYGLKPESAELDINAGPWFYADNLQPFLMAQGRIGIDRFYVDLFGGGGLSWNPVMRPLKGTIEADLAGRLSGEDATDISFTSLTVDNALGYGWLAGGGFGLNIQGVDVDLNATYKSMTHGVVVTGEYYRIESGEGVQEFSSAADLTDFRVILRGITVGINGSIEM
ncbi:MAG: hypothetical protein ACOCYG_03970 [Spirochaetota bacterium]